MKKTVLITGATSGIGKAAAEYFLDRGWNVVATGRRMDALEQFTSRENCLATRCDVTDEESMNQAVAAAMSEFGSIDVLVNNAGYGAVGPFEAATPDAVRRQFDVNVFGLMGMMWAVLPQMRSQKNGGTIINISSIGGRVTFPLYSVYHSTKWAVEGLTESMRFEMKQHGVRMKLVEPGAIKTDFYGRSMDLMSKEGLTAYNDYIQEVMPSLQHAGSTGSSPEVVAKAIYKAATDTSSKLRYPVGGNAPLFLKLRWLLGDRIFSRMVAMVIGRSKTKPQ